MIRVVLFLLALAFIAAGFAWIADHPGDVVLTWMGYRAETSMMVAAIGLLVLILVAILVWSLLRAILRSPGNISLFFRHRRAMKGYLAISRGLIAIGAGDLRLARRSTDEAARLSPGDPLTLLLTAQSAQLAGDRAGAERAFHEMTRHDETKLLGLRGLYIEAQRRNDAVTARRVAEEAAKAAPALSWAGQALLDHYCAVADWGGALAALENLKGTLDKPVYRRQRAVLLTARALALAESDRDASHAAVLEAVKLAPGLIPAAALAGRQLAEKGEQRKARRILEAAWALGPHPDLAEAYANLRFGDSARERLARMQALSEKSPGQIEGALAVARAALEAREFETARAALAPYLSAPPRRVAALMSEIEEMEGDEGRAREWMSRAMRASGDPAWTADGVVSNHWMPVSPNGRLDGFEWRLPLAEIGVTRPVIEIAPTAPGSPVKPLEAGASSPIDAETVLIANERPSKTGSSAHAQQSIQMAEPIIPLVHAPDDPGPDAPPDGEPRVAGEPWQRFR